MKLWKRRLYVEVDGVTLPDILTVNFSINFSEQPDTDSGEVTIYNLSKDSVRRIKKNSKIRISAGYDDDYGNIFYGQVLHIQTYWDGVDKVTNITLGDSSTSYRRLQYSRSFAPNVTNDEILLHLITRAGLGIGDFDTVKNPVYPHGVNVSGKLQDLINRYAKASGSRFYVNKMRAYVRPQRKGQQIGFRLDKDTGLIEIPEEIETEIDEKVYKGYSVRCLLNHQIDVDNIIQIKSKSANGYFRVSSGTHEGSNTDNDYYTTMEVYPI